MLIYHNTNTYITLSNQWYCMIIIWIYWNQLCLTSLVIILCGTHWKTLNCHRPVICLPIPSIGINENSFNWLIYRHETVNRQTVTKMHSMQYTRYHLLWCPTISKFGRICAIGNRKLNIDINNYSLTKTVETQIFLVFPSQQLSYTKNFVFSYSVDVSTHSSRSIFK